MSVSFRGACIYAAWQSSLRPVARALPNFRVSFPLSSSSHVLHYFHRLLNRAQDVVATAMISEARSKTAAVRWSTRIVPVVLALIVVYATYMITRRVCRKFRSYSGQFNSLQECDADVLGLVDYFLKPLRNEAGTAITFLVLGYIFLPLMTASYLRTLYEIIFNPGLVPLGPRALSLREQEDARSIRRQQSGHDDLEGGRYDEGPDMNPDSPGLENFYTKDVFCCGSDGRPIWCSSCQNWKPDRAHHSGELNRCVLKMDHYCPWVGGIVSETCKFKHNSP